MTPCRMEYIFIVVLALSAGLLSYLVAIFVSDWRATKKFWKDEAQRRQNRRI